MFQKVFDYLITTVNDGGSISYIPTTAGNIALFLVVVLLFIAMAAFAGNKKKTRVKQLAFSAMAVTLTVVTSFIKLPSLPFGGSITLFSMFFICLIGYLYGTKAGIITGIAYGFINLILQPYIYFPVQLLLDYPIAFGCLGLAGIFSNSKYGILKGYLIGVFGRYVCHVISGYVFFASYAPEGMNPMIYTLGYNATYIVPEAVATILLLLVPPVQNALKQIKKMAAEE
ncbi:MAG: energy-coupled thiamine transporter ThiT [Herbinix sp.]|nr:energy-coupled thiamine transporter ThiT [Herbinix sp.]